MQKINLFTPFHFRSWGNMDNFTERHKEKMVDAFVSKGVYGACMVTSTLLVNRLQVGKVIEGYLVFDDMKSYLRHYWCSIDGVNSIFKGCLSQIPPIGYQYVREMNKVEVKELEAGFRCYASKPKAYWKKAVQGQ